MSMRNFLNIVNEQRLEEAAVPPTDYGYWISPEGEIIPVDYQDHGDKIAELGIDNSIEALSEGWLRIIAYCNWLCVEGLFKYVGPKALMALRKLTATPYGNYTLEDRLQKRRYEDTKRADFLTHLEQISGL